MSTEEEFFFDLIIKGKATAKYFEEDGKPLIAFTMDDETQKYFDENEDSFTNFSEYIQRALLVADYAGFEPPSEFYEAIKAYVESDGDGKGL